MKNPKTMTSRVERFQNLAARTPRQTIPFINKVDDETTELFVYGIIGGGFFSESSTEDLVKEISAIDTEKILVRINSPGGAVFDGMAVYNSLRTHPATVTAQIDGVAASIASVVAMAGSTVRMLRGTQLMIHKPLMFGGGNADDFRELAELLDQVEGSIVDVYKAHSDLSVKDIKAAMKAETWYNPEAALDAGFATELDEDEDAVENRYDLSAIFDNVPEALRTEPTVRDIEQMFRGTGMSRSRSERAAVAAIATLNPEGEPSGEHQGDPEIQATIDRVNRILTE